MKPRIDAVAVVVAVAAIGFGIVGWHVTANWPVTPMWMQWSLALILIASGGAGLLALRAPASKNNRKEIRHDSHPF